MAPEQALAFAGQVEGLGWVKLGLELFVQVGPQVVAQLRGQGPLAIISQWRLVSFDRDFQSFSRLNLLQLR